MSQKIFCTVVTDAEGMVGLDSPIVFHTRAESDLRAEAFVIQLLKDEYLYDSETVDQLDIFTFELKESEIIDAEG